MSIRAPFEVAELSWRQHLQGKCLNSSREGDMSRIAISSPAVVTICSSSCCCFNSNTGARSWPGKSFKLQEHNRSRVPTPSNAGKSVMELVVALRECRDLECGKKLHLEASESGCNTSNYVAAALIRMYSKCRDMASAREVFDRLAQPDVEAWNEISVGYVRNGDEFSAMELLSRMDCEPDYFTYVVALRACASLASETTDAAQKQSFLDKGISIHREIRQQRLEPRTFVANALLNMYSKCGSMDRARKVFERMRHKDVVSWSSIMHGYVQDGQSLEAMNLFARMDCEPDAFTYVAVFNACAAMADAAAADDRYSWLEQGRWIHQRASANRLDSTNIIVGNALIDMYCKCGSPDLAQAVFAKMNSRNVFTWKWLIQGFIRNKKNLAAVDLFFRMNCVPDQFTYAAALQGCAALGFNAAGTENRQFWLEQGMKIHAQIRARRLELSMVLQTTLVDMYSKCGSMHRARDVFDEMIRKNVVTWTALILGYVHNGDFLVAMEAFAAMDCEPGPGAFAGALRACAGLGNFADMAGKQLWLYRGSVIHERIRESGLEGNVVVGQALAEMYSKCGSMSRVGATTQEWMDESEAPFFLEQDQVRVLGSGSVSRVY